MSPKKGGEVLLGQFREQGKSGLPYIPSFPGGRPCTGHEKVAEFFCCRRLALRIAVALAGINTSAAELFFLPCPLKEDTVPT